MKPIDTMTDARGRAAFARFFRQIDGYARRAMQRRGLPAATLRGLDQVAALALETAAIVNAELEGSGCRPIRLPWAADIRSRVKQRLTARKARKRVR